MVNIATQFNREKGIARGATFDLVIFYRVRAVPGGYREDFPDREGGSRTGRLPVKPGGLTHMKPYFSVPIPFLDTEKRPNPAKLKQGHTHRHSACANNR